MILESAAIKCSVFLLLLLPIAGQSYAFPADGPTKHKFSRLDLVSGIEVSDSAKRTRPKEFRMKKDPWKAVLYSALLPGAGQYYNRSYWKIPVIAGLGGYFGYGIVNNNNKYADYRDQYTQSQTTANPGGNPQLKTLRDFYKDQRDDFIVYALILYVVNLIDAYVDAQLFDFDVSDSKSFSNGGVSLKISF